MALRITEDARKLESKLPCFSFLEVPAVIYQRVIDPYYPEGRRH